MTTTLLPRKIGLGLFMTALAALTIGIRLLIGPRTVDDAYITFRYASNIVRGMGFVYNLGERVLGTTTPLYTLILSALHLFFTDLELVALVTNAVADVATAALMHLLIVKVTGRHTTAVLCSLLFVFSAGSIRFTSGGLESGVFVFLLLLSLWLFINERYIFSGISVALTALTRPEGLLLFFVVIIVYFFRFRRFPWHLALAGVGTLLPWTAFSIVYFGSPVPHSVLAKKISYDFPPMYAIKNLLGYLVTHILPLWVVGVSRLAKYGFCAAVLGFGSVAAYRVWARSENFMAFWLFPIVYIGAYTAANPPVWEWYAVPLIPFTIIALVLGAAEVVEPLAYRILSPRNFRVVQVVLISFLLIAGTFQVLQIVQHDPRQGRELAYADIARKLNGIYRPGHTISGPEIGTLGYKLPDSRILDPQGLVSPQALPFRQAIARDLEVKDYRVVWVVGSSVPPDLIEEELPEFVITFEVFAGLLLESEWFGSNYRLILKEPSDLLGGDGVLVFQRISPHI
jgi:hypothetical protein